jgi:hypothetical protein
MLTTAETIQLWWWMKEYAALVECYWQEENPHTRRKTCPSATLSTTNPILTGLGLNPGHSGHWPTNNRVTHDTNTRPTSSTPQGLPWDRVRASAMKTLRVTTWSMARPFDKCFNVHVMACEQQVTLTHLHGHRVTLTESVFFFQHYVERGRGRRGGGRTLEALVVVTAWTRQSQRYLPARNESNNLQIVPVEQVWSSSVFS